jgi:hypothetical protein
MRTQIDFVSLNCRPGFPEYKLNNYWPCRHVQEVTCMHTLRVMIIKYIEFGDRGWGLRLPHMNFTSYVYMKGSTCPL